MPLTTLPASIIFVSVSEQEQLYELFCRDWLLIVERQLYRWEMQIMATLKNITHRLISMVASSVIAFAYNPNQAEIFQLLCNIYEICSFMIQ